jgi:hypothetical protein
MSLQSLDGFLGKSNCGSLDDMNQFYESAFGVNINLVMTI